MEESSLDQRNKPSAAKSDQPLLYRGDEDMASEEVQSIRVYPTRWYICGIFFVFCIMQVTTKTCVIVVKLGPSACCAKWVIEARLTHTVQSSMWSFFSPIQAPLKQLYGWSDVFIEWLGKLRAIVFSVRYLILTLSYTFAYPLILSCDRIIFILFILSSDLT